MVEKENKAIKNELETIEEEAKVLNNNILSIHDLIDRISLLSKNKNPFNVAKEIEEIKSIFYIKLKSKDKDEIINKESNEKDKKIKQELHPLEIKFKNIIGEYRKIKAKYRKNKEEEEVENLKVKRQIIENIKTITKEEESIKITFEKFRNLQYQWKRVGHVPITESNNLWQSYHHNIEVFYDFIKINNDLRDLDFKRNLEEKNSIYKKAELLLNEKSINKAHNKLQDLHEHWKIVGPVVREKKRTPLEKIPRNKQKN
jgi:hypothetical protein